MPRHLWACLAVMSGCDVADPTAYDGGWAVAPLDAGGVRDASAHVDAAVEPDAGALGGLFSPCTTNEDCQSNFCRTFMHAGDVCTRNCTTAADCGNTGGTCNMRNICRPP